MCSAKRRNKRNMTCRNPRYKRLEVKDCADFPHYYCNYCCWRFICVSNTRLRYKQLFGSDTINAYSCLDKKNSIQNVEQITRHYRCTIDGAFEDTAKYAAHTERALNGIFGLFSFRVMNSEALLKKGDNRYGSYGSYRF